jgi:hypothetical protein
MLWIEIGVVLLVLVKIWDMRDQAKRRALRAAAQRERAEYKAKGWPWPPKCTGVSTMKEGIERITGRECKFDIFGNPYTGRKLRS